MVDMTLTPLVMLKKLLIAENSLQAIPEDKFSFESPTEVAGAQPVQVTVDGKEYTITRNTQAIARITGVDGYIDSSVPVTYQRISLANLWAEGNEPTIRQVDIQATPGGDYSIGNIIAEILRKYKVNGVATDFNYIISGDKTTITMVAKATNLSYLGEVVVKVDASLASRILVTQLDGFTWLPAGEVIPDQSARILEAAKMGYTA